VSPEEASGVILGYTCLLDITMRGGEDRSTRKSFDTFTPVGPWIVTPDEFGEVGSKALRCRVNGEVRQEACFRELIWDVPRLVAYASSVMTLRPGDIVTTGTPAGVGEIHDGDVIEVEIENIGTLAARASEQHACPCPTRGGRSGPVPPPSMPSA
jgi:2-keto-4-pentenoate hydratase/2-oxohepta-3-ene-1,7-dioic acid hydratase in catechol pathway